ncbi:hypothetical protein ACIA98_31600 [Streptomyces sp. NPDC051366]|uniref:hypothetical protein n=1 Tax=Streptomyces sp. NPDC051366 TaxID=3365652 RepID=UPI00379D2B7D
MAVDATQVAGPTRPEAAPVRAADLSFVRTQPGRIHSSEITGPLTGHLDTGRVAAAGHSLGGAAALPEYGTLVVHHPGRDPKSAA